MRDVRTNRGALAVTTVLRISACAALLSVAALAAILGYQAATLPARLTTRADVLVAELAQARADLARTEAAALERLASLERTTDARLGAVQRAADTRLGEALAEIRAGRLDLTAQTARAVDQVAGVRVDVAAIRADVAPVLQRSAAAIQDAQDIADDLYPDIKASVESWTVAARGIGETSEAIGKAAPKLAADFSRLGGPDRWHCHGCACCHLTVRGAATLARETLGWN